MSATTATRFELAGAARAAHDAGNIAERDRLLGEAKAGLSEWSLAVLEPLLPEAEFLLLGDAAAELNVPATALRKAALRAKLDTQALYELAEWKRAATKAGLV